MSDLRDRAKDFFPTLYLTLLSMIQALALEALWTAASEKPHLRAWDAEAVVGWLQLGATLQVIFLVWIAFVQMVMRFRWVPSIQDSAVPFLLGLGQFALVATVDSERVHLWFYVLGAMAAFATWINVLTMNAARTEPENLSELGPPAASRRGLLGWSLQFGPSAAAALLAGGGLQASGGYRPFALAFVAVTNLVLFGLVASQARDWQIRLRPRGIEAAGLTPPPTGRSAPPPT